MINLKTILLVMFSYLSTVATGVGGLWVEKGAQNFSDITQVAYATVFVVALAPALATLIAKLQEPPRNE